MEIETEAGTTTTESNQDVATEYGARRTYVAPFLFSDQVDNLAAKRRIVAGLTLVAAALSWVVSFIFYGLAAETLAWCVALKNFPVIISQPQEKADLAAQQQIQPSPPKEQLPQQMQSASNYALPSRWATKTYGVTPVRYVAQSSTFAQRPKTSSTGSAALEEVSPPELIELADTQGDSKANESYQAGGRSSGGKGAQSALSTYLKELHKRIKRAWSPPVGETRKAEILFRIKSNGQLASIKLMRSSGDEDADEAAMHAIAANSPFKPLPDDVPGKFLDVLYTFNYKVDELSEVSGSRTQ